MTKLLNYSDSANDSLHNSAHECETFSLKSHSRLTLKAKRKKNGDYIFIYSHNGKSIVYNIYEMLSIIYKFLRDTEDRLNALSFLDRYATDNRLYWYLRSAVVSSSAFWDIKRESSRCAKNQKTYLIKDSRTGATKIGKSNNPLKREKTLQSDALSLELLYTCDDNIETLLHKKYKDKRIRGEWFNLTDKDIEYIVDKYNFKKAKKQ